MRKVNTRNNFSIKSVLFIFLLFTITLSDFKTNSLTNNDSNTYQSNDQSLNLFNSSFEEENQFDMSFGAMKDLFARGRYVYTANERGGLIIFDTINLTNITITSIFDEERSFSNELWAGGGLTSSLFVLENTTFLADGENGLIILNTSDILSPKKLCQFKDSTEGIYKVLVQDNCAYLFGTESLMILNVSDLRNPIMISKTNLSHVGDFIYDYQVADDYLLISSTNLVIYNISNSANLSEIGRINLSNGVQLTVSDGYLYMLSSYVKNFTQIYSLKIFNVTQISMPQFISETLLGSNYPEDISILDTTLYVATTRKILAYDIVNKTKPIHLGEISELTYGGSNRKITAKRIKESNTTVIFCADYKEGLFVLNFTNPKTPTILSFFDMGKKYTKIASNDNIICIGSWSEFANLPSKLEIFSISDTTISFACSIKYNGTIADLLLHDNLLFIVSSNFGLEILDISSPTQPLILAQFDDFISGNHLESIFLDQERNYLFLANYWYGVAILDITIPSSPTLISEFNFNSMLVVDIFVKDNLVYVADGRQFGGYAIVNSTNITNPLLLYSSFLDETVYDICVQNDYLYLGTSHALLRVFDVSNPRLPTSVSHYTDHLSVPASIIIDNDIAFITHQGNGLYAIDLSNPYKLKVLAIFRDQYTGISYDVSIKDNYILLADGWDGLEILSFISPDIPKQVFLFITIFPPSLGIVLLIIIVILMRRKK